MKIVFLDASTLGAISLDPIAKLGNLITYPTSNKEEAIERVKDCDVLIVNKVQVTQELLSKASKLKLICEAATGVNNIDLKACEQRGIIVKNVAGYSTNSVAQLTFAMVLSLMCDLPYFDTKVKSGTYSKSGLFTDVSKPYIEMDGKTMGIIGMGAIGLKVAQIAVAFGMRVQYYSTSGTSHCTTYPSVGLKELMQTSDIISIHAPLNEKTKGLIGLEELKLLKPTAVIANLGRGGIVQEDALATVIDEGLIRGAALDVYETEPLPLTSPLLNIKNKDKLILMPHLGWASTEALTRLVALVADNIKMYYKG